MITLLCNYYYIYCSMSQCTSPVPHYLVLFLQVQMELNEPSDPGVCVRAGCNNPVIESQDWDKEYCSNECVASHCRCVFVSIQTERIVLHRQTTRDL